MTSVTLLMDQSFLCHHTCQSSVPIMRVSSLCLEMVKTHLENNAGRLTKGIISFEKKHGGGGGVRLSVLMVQRDGGEGEETGGGSGGGVVGGIVSSALLIVLTNVALWQEADG